MVVKIELNLQLVHVTSPLECIIEIQVIPRCEREEMREGESAQRGVACCELPSDRLRVCTANRDGTVPS